jgi:O-glycosyl hydrolase
MNPPKLRSNIRALMPSRLNRALQAGVTAFVAGSLCIAGAFAANLTMSATDRQAIQGWGIFPGYSHSNWGDVFRSIANRPAVRDKVFELGVNTIRVELASNSYNATAANKLNLAAMDELKTHILMAKNKGVPHWIVSVWSPPAPFKTPLQDTRGVVDGVRTYMNMAYKEQFCEYYANALAYLRDNGCGTPAMISVQNEPNYPVWYDGCSFYSKADYQEICRRMRFWLDSKGLTSVRIGSSESAHPGNPVFTGTGTNFWTDVSLFPVNDAIAHTYGGAHWDFQQFRKAPMPIWVTEWCNIDGGDQISSAVKSSAHIARDLVNMNAAYWIYWNSYNPNTSPGATDLVYGSATAPQTTKLFQVLKRLFQEVKPDGTFKVRSFTSDDAAFHTGFGSDYAKLVHVIGFKSPTRTVVLIANMTTTSQSIVLRDIPGSSLRRYEMSSTTPANAPMDDRGTVTVTSGTSSSFSAPANSVQILTGPAM